LEIINSKRVEKYEKDLKRWEYIEEEQQRQNECLKQKQKKHPHVMD